MHPIRRRKLLIVMSMMVGLLVVVFLILYALRQNINLFYSPSDLMNQHTQSNRMIRLGGMVVKGSVSRGQDPLDVQFKLTDYKNTITVLYHGILPDLFREEQGIVTLGQLENQIFRAHEVLAKHDENYMPREVKETLQK